MSITMLGTREAKQKISALWPTRGKLWTSTGRGSQDALGTRGRGLLLHLFVKGHLCAAVWVYHLLWELFQNTAYTICAIRNLLLGRFLYPCWVHCSTHPMWSQKERNSCSFLCLQQLGGTNLWSSVLTGSDWGAAQVQASQGNRPCISRPALTICYFLIFLLIFNALFMFWSLVGCTYKTKK